MTDLGADFVYKVWHAGGVTWRFEVARARGYEWVTSGCGDSEAGAAAQAEAIIVVERNKAAAEWRNPE